MKRGCQHYGINRRPACWPVDGACFTWGQAVLLPFRGGMSWQDPATLRPSATVAAAALHGIEDPTDVAGHALNPGVLFCNPSVLLFHPGKDLPDFLAMLLVEASMF